MLWSVIGCRPNTRGRECAVPLHSRLVRTPGLWRISPLNSYLILPKPFCRFVNGCFYHNRTLGIRAAVLFPLPLCPSHTHHTQTNIYSHLIFCVSRPVFVLSGVSHGAKNRTVMQHSTNMSPDWNYRESLLFVSPQWKHLFPQGCSVCWMLLFSL